MATDATVDGPGQAALPSPDEQEDEDISLAALYLSTLCPAEHATQLLAKVEDPLEKARLSNDMTRLQRAGSGRGTPSMMSPLREKSGLGSTAAAGPPPSTSPPGSPPYTVSPKPSHRPPDPEAERKRAALASINAQAQEIMHKLSTRNSQVTAPTSPASRPPIPPPLTAASPAAPTFSASSLDSHMLSELNQQIQQMKEKARQADIARRSLSGATATPTQCLPTKDGLPSTSSPSPAPTSVGVSADVSKLRQQALEMLVGLRTMATGNGSNKGEQGANVGPAPTALTTPSAVAPAPVSTAPDPPSNNLKVALRAAMIQVVDLRTKLALKRAAASAVPAGSGTNQPALPATAPPDLWALRMRALELLAKSRNAILPMFPAVPCKPSSRPGSASQLILPGDLAPPAATRAGPSPLSPAHECTKQLEALAKRVAVLEAGAQPQPPPPPAAAPIPPASPPPGWSAADI